MENSDLIGLKDESVYPDDNVLKKILGGSFTAYKNVLNFLAVKGLAYQWRYYKDGKIWLCKVQLKMKTIIWMSAWKGYIQATVYIPQKHIDGIYTTGINEKTIEFILNTRNSGKSKPCIFRLDESFRSDDFEKIVEYKLKIK